MTAQQYRIPVSGFEDQNTEHWDPAAGPKPHAAELDTSPPVPKILPNVATMVARPDVPSILRGPSAPQPQVPQPRAQPAYAHVVLPPISAPLPRQPSIAPASPAGWLVAREVASSVFRSWVGLGVLALALGVGVYLAVASKSEDHTVKAPTERDRALAIMNGQAEPEPVTVNAPEPVAAPVDVKPTAEPIALPTAEPIEPSVEQPKAEAVAVAEEVSVDEIEMEPAAARPAKRAARSSRARKKTVAVVETKKTSNDPVLAIINEKPKKVAATKNVSTTEISAPRGAAPTNGTGKVTITSDVKAIVYLDGRPTGKSAPTALVIPAGDHQITLLDPATKKAKTATIALVANKSLTISKTFN